MKIRSLNSSDNTEREIKIMEKVNAVVVTYNRKALLEECITALLNQTYKLNKIIIIDNASTDGTTELLKERYNIPEIETFTLNKNTGGAGGFYYGTKKAVKDADWVWEMDDDTIPADNALEELLKAKEKINENVSFLASSVFGTNGEPMNVPTIDGSSTTNGYSDWYKYLKEGIVKIEHATLVSLLFSTKAIAKVGAPHPYFFIWGDDTEYTLRMTKYYGNAYFVGKSVVIHKRIGAKNISVLDECNPNRIKMYKLMFRNNLVSTKSYKSKKVHIKYFLHSIIVSYKALFESENYRWLRFKSVQSGILEYLLGKYNKKAFNNRFNNLAANYLDEYLVEMDD